MASTSIQDLTPDTQALASAFLSAAKAQGFDLQVASTLRSCADQGTSTGPVVIQGMTLKRASGCKSFHVWGRAFDVVITNDPSQQRYAELGALGKSMGLVWGGDFRSNPDPIHFQNSAGIDIKTLCPDPLKCDEAVASGPGTPTNPLPYLPRPVTRPRLATEWGVVAFVLGATTSLFVSNKIRRKYRARNHW